MPGVIGYYFPYGYLFTMFDTLDLFSVSLSSDLIGDHRPHSRTEVTLSSLTFICVNTFLGGLIYLFSCEGYW